MKTKEQQEPVRYEPPKVPDKEAVIEVRPDTSDFSSSEKAEALIRHLELSVGDTLRERNEEYFTVNPRMVLGGHAPEVYKTEIEHLKALCTPKMVAELSKEIKKKKKTKNFYKQFTKRMDKRMKLLKETEDAKYFTDEKDTKKASPHGHYNCVYILVEDDRKEIATQFIEAWFGRPIPNTQEWREEDDGEYRVLTDSEAEQACDDYLDESKESWIEAIKADRTEESFEDWKETVKNSDGRGNQLSGYDGSEDEQEVNGTTYYIYRTN